MVDFVHCVGAKHLTLTWSLLTQGFEISVAKSHAAASGSRFPGHFFQKQILFSKCRFFGKNLILIYKQNSPKRMRPSFLSHVFIKSLPFASLYISHFSVNGRDGADQEIEREIEGERNRKKEIDSVVKKSCFSCSL